MSVEETGETRVRTDCLNFDVSNAYNLKKIIRRSTGIILFVGF